MADTDVNTDGRSDEKRARDPLEERRRSTRFRREAESDFALISDPEAVRGRAEVYDESLGGISLIVDDASHFEIGMEVQINYDGGPSGAVVRHITERKDGRYVIGFQCG